MKSITAKLNSQCPLNKSPYRPGLVGDRGT